ncbi:MAG: MFS transporter [Chloroflexota bacterium]|nr:MFS transporter [Chloroflexota bacterium]
MSEIAEPISGLAVEELGPALLRPLRDRDFRLLFGGETTSFLGDQFHLVALAWLTLQLTGSGLALGTVLMTAAVPRAVLVLLGGALSDRFSPRGLMLSSNASRAVVVAIIATLVLTGTTQLWQLYLLAGVFGVADAVYYPAINTILPMLVAERRLPAANALVHGSQQLAGLVGPALAGLLVAAVQTGPAFAIDAVSFTIAAVALVLIRGGRRAATTGAATAPQSVLQSIGPGLRYAWSDPAIRTLVVLTSALNLAFTGPVSVGLAWLANNRFDGGSAVFGIILSAFGAGALLGAVLAGSVRRVPSLGAVVLGIGVLLGIGLALIGTAPNVPVVLAIVAPMGILIGFINVQVIAWMQARVAETMRGRVMSLLMLGSIGLAPISLAATGVLLDVGAATLTFAFAGAICVAASLAGFAWGLPARMEAVAD